MAAALAAAFSAAPSFAQTAASWPTKPIRMIVPFSAGGADDLMAQSAAEGASKALGQPVIVENKPGGSTTLGADLVAKAAPDGYTFLISAAGVISNSMIKKHMPYKDADLTPVASWTSFPTRADRNPSMRCSASRSRPLPKPASWRCLS